MLDELIHLFHQIPGRRGFREGGRDRGLRRFRGDRRRGSWDPGGRRSSSSGGSRHPAEGSCPKADQPGDEAALTPALSRPDGRWGTVDGRIESHSPVDRVRIRNGGRVRSTGDERIARRGLLDGLNGPLRPLLGFRRRCDPRECRSVGVVTRSRGQWTPRSPLGSPSRAGALIGASLGWRRGGCRTERLDWGLGVGMMGLPDLERLGGIQSGTVPPFPFPLERNPGAPPPGGHFHGAGGCRGRSWSLWRQVPMVLEPDLLAQVWVRLGVGSPGFQGSGSAAARTWTAQGLRSAAIPAERWGMPRAPSVLRLTFRTPARSSLAPQGHGSCGTRSSIRLACRARS